MDSATIISEHLEIIETLKQDLMKATDELCKARLTIVELRAIIDLLKN
jgi:hypothetical protein